MSQHLPDPFDRIHRLVGRRSLPVDWPKTYDSYDAYDDEDEFLLTLHYKALAQLLDGGTFSHTVTVEFDGPLTPIVVPPSCSLDISVRLTFGDFFIDNPDKVIPKAEIADHIRKLLGAM